MQFALARDIGQVSDVIRRAATSAGDQIDGRVYPTVNAAVDAVLVHR